MTWQPNLHPRGRGGRFTWARRLAGQIDDHLIRQQETMHRKTGVAHFHRTGTGGVVRVADRPGGWAHRLSEAVGDAIREDQYKQIYYHNVSLSGEYVREGTGPIAGADQMWQTGRRGMNQWSDDPLREALAGRLRRGEPLRGEYADGLTEDNVSLSQMARDIDSAIDQGVLTKHAELWRGIVLHPDEVDRLFPVGAEVTDRSFMATSMDFEDAALLLAHRLIHEPDGTREGYFLRILAPAGTHVAPGARGLSELVLRRDTRTVVRRREPVRDRGRSLDFIGPGDENGDDVIVLEVIPDGQAASA